MPLKLLPKLPDDSVDRQPVKWQALAEDEQKPLENSSKLPDTTPSAPPLAEVAEEFVADAIARDKGSFTSTAELVAASRGWCAAHGQFAFGRRILAKQLARIGGVPHSTGKARGWRGVKIR
jgi:hypothetical protein